MKAKFTPGPWRMCKRATGTVESEAGRSIATCMGYSTNTDNGEHIEENLANSHLIAAAPDLLVALDQLADRCEKLNIMYPEDSGMWHAMTLEARAAIAKAKGE